MTLAAGIDVSERRGLDVVVLDDRRRLAAPARAAVTPGALDALLADFGDDLAIVAIDSPPGPGVRGRARPCEVALRRRGIQIFSTPAEDEGYAHRFHNWVRVGAAAFAAAERAGFSRLAVPTSPRGHALEVFPHASDVLLRGELPPAGTTRRLAAKRAWRAETLRRAGVHDVAALATIDAIDAALAALTGLLALEGRVELVGESPHWIAVPRTDPPGALLRRRSGARPARVVGEHELDDDPTRIDTDALWRFLSSAAYWGRWRSRADLEAQLTASWRVVGLYERATGAMVGFARAISDGVALAYLADVYVDERARGRGLGQALVAEMIENGPGAGFRWMLHTADAHGLYARFGFAPGSDRYLERPAAAERI